ncbi:MAG: tRNA dihydrouridine synthase DusB [Deltaproteobacteria bacterium]|nr:tRNA dihydrouridine synthase DusB [Deltaproteobacteria bacterium]
MGFPTLTIGRLSIDPPVLLAPMSAITNLPMRTLAERHGCGLTITEFLPAAALAARHKNALSRLTPSALARPFGVQIYGRDPGQMRRAAALAVDSGAALVDINMGCPAKKVTRGVCGAALMREPSLAGELVQAVIEGVSGRAEVTVKMRTGWDEDDKNAPQFAQLMVSAGAQAITVHGRTRQQRFSGVADYATIAQVKRAVDVPVIANGDIVDVASAERALNETGADGVMIGRAASGNPWIFSQLAAWFAQRPLPDPPSDVERLAVFREHLVLYLEISDERRAVFEMRKFARPYLAPLADAEAICRQIYRAESLAAIEQILDGVLCGLQRISA